MTRATKRVGAILALVLSGAGAWAQTAEVAPVRAGANPVRTFYLTNISQINEGADLTTALRNLLDPQDKVYFVQWQNAIVVQGTPDQLTLAERILKDLDRPKKTYRLTYTVIDSDAGKRVGVQHFSMVVVTGQRTTMKQGSKVPIVTGSYNPGTSSQNSQVTYLDIGLNFDASLDEFVNGVRLRTKVEQSSVAEEHSGLGPQDPVVRQTSVEGTSFLSVGKPLVLGSLDVPGSTRHLDVEVVMDQVAP